MTMVRLFIELEKSIENSQRGLTRFKDTWIRSYHTEKQSRTKEQNEGNKLHIHEIDDWISELRTRKQEKTKSMKDENQWDIGGKLWIIWKA